VNPSARAQSWALLVARITTGVYVVEILLNLTRPRVLPNEPALSIFQTVEGAGESLNRLLSVPRAVFWLVLIGIVVGVVLQVVALREPAGSPRATKLTWATLGALLGPFALIPLYLLSQSPGAALACVPTTAVVLVLLHNCQRFVRVPPVMLLATFGWGALIAFGFTRACSSLAYGTVNGYLTKLADDGTSGPFGAQTAFVEAQYDVMHVLVFHLAILAQLTIGAGVVLALLMFRHRITDAVSGGVLGAAAGLGYTLIESVVFIELFSLLSFVNGASAGFELWIRQVATLVTGRVAFGALLGAAIGLASTLADRRQRRLVVGAGLVAAIGADAGNEVVSAWLSHLARDHVSIGSPLDTLVVSPLLLLVVQLPFFVLALGILRLGTRARAAAAAVAIPAEAAAGSGAITAPEVPVLTNPALRLWTVEQTRRRLGFTAARALMRLQAAQLDLAGWRWAQDHADRTGLAGPGDPAEGDALREKVLRLKQPAVTSRRAATP
jgi:hypothetical protein